MELIEAIRTRRSIRSFKPTPVPKKVLEELMDVARWAPSGGNGQGWHFAILGGKTLDKIKAELIAIAKDGKTFTDGHPDFPRTVPYSKVITSRRDAWQKVMDGYRFPPGPKSVQQQKEENRIKVQRFFDAPNAIFIISEDMSPASANLSVGLMAQTICLAALNYGLGTCIMGAPIAWPEVIREIIPIPKDKAIATSIAIGYPETDTIVNTHPRTRVPLKELVDWYGF